LAWMAQKNAAFVSGGTFYTVGGYFTQARANVKSVTKVTLEK